MMPVEKQKNLFIINLPNNKKSYFDFSNNTYYGVSGKIVHNFSNGVKEVLEKNYKKSFLSAFFFERMVNRGTYKDIRNWDYGMVETINSLYSNEYNNSTYLLEIADFCHLNNYKLDKIGVRDLTLALKKLEYEKRKLPIILGRNILLQAIYEVRYPDMPGNVINMLCYPSSEKIKKIIVNDYKKIVFSGRARKLEYVIYRLFL